MLELERVPLPEDYHTSRYATQAPDRRSGPFSFPALEAAVSKHTHQTKLVLPICKQNRNKKALPTFLSEHTGAHLVCRTFRVKRAKLRLQTQVASPITHISGGRANAHKLHHRALTSPVVEPMRTNCITEHSHLRWSSNSVSRHNCVRGALIRLRVYC